MSLFSGSGSRKPLRHNHIIIFKGTKEGQEEVAMRAGRGGGGTGDKKRTKEMINVR
jgi:hypothetical protein